MKAENKCTYCGREDVSILSDGTILCQNPKCFRLSLNNKVKEVINDGL